MGITPTEEHAMAQWTNDDSYPLVRRAKDELSKRGKTRDDPDVLFDDALVRPRPLLHQPHEPATRTCRLYGSWGDVYIA